MSTLVKINRSQFTAIEGADLFRHIFPENLMKIAGKAGGGNQEYKWSLIMTFSSFSPSVFRLFISVLGLFGPVVHRFNDYLCLE